MRSIVRRVVMVIGISAVVGGTTLGVGAQGDGTLDSGAVGLTRAEIEADFGRSPEPIDVPGHPIYDQTYAYETQAGTLTVSYRSVNGEDLAVYVEFAWRGEGVPAHAARNLVEDFLPADAELTELYIAPPTASGPLALVTHRYQSDDLVVASPTFAPEILVISQQTWGDPSAVESERVQAVSLITRERTQSTP
jgi:hypothetical protein